MSQCPLRFHLNDKNCIKEKCSWWTESQCCTKQNVSSLIEDITTTIDELKKEIDGHAYDITSAINSNNNQ